MIKKPIAERKKWPRYCLYAALGLLVLAGILYVIYCQQINSEFGHNEKYFGEQFDEIYALNHVDEDLLEPLLKQGRAALRFIGTKEQCSQFGVMSRWCVDTQYFPEAHTVKSGLDCITAKLNGKSGYMWVAYWQKVTDENGELVCASGTEDERILARWKLEKIDGKWTATSSDEAP